MGQQSAGHVFVTRGLVESYAGDAVVIPTDVRFSVREYWYPAIGVGTAGEVDNLRPDGWGSGGRLSGRSAGRRAVWFVDVGGGDVASLGAAVREVLSDLTLEAPAPRAGRQRPLVVMPLVGIGGGGLEPGDVIETVLDAAESVLAEPGSPDVALVVSDARDYAAVQHVRRRRRRWALPGHLVGRARALGERARDGELAIFVGAGLSIPAGLPTWKDLMREAIGLLGDRAPGGAASLNLLDQAELVRRIDDQLLTSVVKQRCSTDRHALGHALVTAIGARENVTTNFDTCLELADVDGVLAVLPEQRPRGQQPWLLKMHGTVGDDENIVLTRGDFARYDARYRPAASVLQSLVLTRHVLFVGVSMEDDNVLRLASEVSLMRDRSVMDRRWGTVLFLDQAPAKEALYGHELDWVTLADIDGVDQARAVDLFLDIVAAHASDDVPWLLHGRYAGMLDDVDRTLVDELRSVGHDVARRAMQDKDTWGPLTRTLELAGWAPGLPGPEDVHGDDEYDGIVRIAAALGCTPAEVAEHLGAEWKPLDLSTSLKETISSWQHGTRAASRRMAEDLVRPAEGWWVGGEPAQVMVALAWHEVLVAKPHGVWVHGTHGLAVLPTDVRAFDGLNLEAAKAHVSAVVLSRRRSFGSCRYCRTVTSPEGRLERDVCHDCGSRWLGVVY